VTSVTIVTPLDLISWNGHLRFVCSSRVVHRYPKASVSGDIRVPNENLKYAIPILYSNWQDERSPGHVCVTWKSKISRCAPRATPNLAAPSRIQWVSYDALFYHETRGSRYILEGAWPYFGLNHHIVGTVSDTVRTRQRTIPGSSTQPAWLCLALLASLDITPHNHSDIPLLLLYDVHEWQVSAHAFQDIDVPFTSRRCRNIQWLRL
jgi:hypothetical protein